MTSPARTPVSDLSYALADGRDRASIEPMAARAFDRANEARAREPRLAGWRLNQDRAEAVLTAIAWAMILRHLDQAGEDVFDCVWFYEPSMFRRYGSAWIYRALFGRSPFTFHPARKTARQWICTGLSLLAWMTAVTWAADRIPVPGTGRFLIGLAVAAVTPAFGMGVATMARKWARASEGPAEADPDYQAATSRVRRRFECPECQASAFRPAGGTYACDECGARYQAAETT